MSLPEHVERNKAEWAVWAAEYVDAAERNWAQDEITWGIWDARESELQVLPELEGKDVIELGCGTAYVSAWLARRGARVVGIDNSPAQLATARTLQREFGIDFPLHLGNAEATPFEDASFDYAISEYGAALWADPYRWIPEAARLLRPGGELLLYTGGAFMMLTMPDLEADGPARRELLRPYFGMHRFTWPDDTSVEFHLPHGELLRVLRDAGFEVERLVEVQPPADAVSDEQWDFVTLEWAGQWPSEEAWVARKRA